MIPRHLIDNSIQSALTQDWLQAIEINLEILEHDPYHTPTLNRLAKAYRETGQLEKAILTYQQVLQYDKYNQIAKRNIHTLQQLTEETATNGKAYNTDFIDEPGKSLTIPLIRLGDAKVIANLEAGQIVSLAVKTHSIAVTNHHQEHIGHITDDVSFKLRQLIKKGHQFRAMIKTIEPKRICIFIKETSRPPQTAPAFNN